MAPQYSSTSTGTGGRMRSRYAITSQVASKPDHSSPPASPPPPPPPPPAYALCISGLLRSLIFREVQDSMRVALLDPLGASVDSFAAVGVSATLAPAENAVLRAGIRVAMSRLGVLAWTDYTLKDNASNRGMPHAAFQWPIRGAWRMATWNARVFSIVRSHADGSSTPGSYARARTQCLCNLFRLLGFGPACRDPPLSSIQALWAHARQLSLACLASTTALR